MKPQATVAQREAALFHDAPDAPVSTPLATIPSSEGESLMAVISRAAENPNTNVDNLERLLSMYERIKANEAKAAYTRAMVLLKPDLPTIGRRGRIEVREKTASGKRDGEITQDTPYARWEDIDEAISPLLAEHGFALTFRSGVAQDGKITVTGILGHTGGHSEETTITLPHDSSGSKNPVQAVGSSLTYGKRYAATFLLNIRTRGDDDDGEAAGADDDIETVEIDELQDLLDRSHSDQGRFFKYMAVAKLADIKKRDMGKAREALNIALSAYQRKSKGGTS